MAQAEIEQWNEKHSSGREMKKRKPRRQRESLLPTMWQYGQHESHRPSKFTPNMPWHVPGLKNTALSRGLLGVWRWRAGEEGSRRPGARPTTLQISFSSVLGVLLGYISEGIKSSA
eukprot:1161565-Pelagomonas_calceolata.AAC.1